MKPRVSRQGQNLHLFYELPHRVHDAFIYPIPAPNGSTIIAYGHDNGIRILWRGGKPLKAPTRPAPKPKQSTGAGGDTVMLISDDDDEEPPAVPSKQAEFEEEDAAVVDSALPVIQDVQIDLGTSVLNLAGPPITSSTFLSVSETIPAIFKQKIVLVAACADSAVRVVTVPLTPPADSAKAAKQSPRPFGEEIAVLSAMNGHPSVPNCVSITWTARDSAAEDDNAQSRSAARSGSKEWDLLIASHSSDAMGSLLLTRASLAANGSALKSKSLTPFQRQYLSSPATHIAFNPSTFPSSLHSHLLIADAKGVLRIYDAVPSSHTQSRSPVAPSPVLPRRGNGAFVATFTSHFDSSTHSTWKPLLGAQWVSLGTAVIALLSNGQWGIWDIAGAGPTPAVRPPNSTSFSLSGTIGSTNTSAASPSAPRSRSTDSRAGLAPMTPNTRTSKTARFFVGSAPASMSSSTSMSKSGAMTGGVEVYHSPSSATGKQIESVLLWYGDDVSQIPDFPTFWSRGASGNVGIGRGLQPIEGMDVGGEKVQGVWEVPTKGGSRDLLTLGERRLVIVTKEIREEPKHAADPDAMDVEDEGERSRIDMSLLSRGELGLGGMDRLLDSMASSSGPATANSGPARRVGFAA